jgi:DNA-binding NarL/FixJ family response regulator
VLSLMAEGHSNQAIAARLGLSEKTVESYIGTIFGKLALEPAPALHRRVLAVLTFLQAR